MKDKEWNNFCMRKYGKSIRNKILEAYIPFAKASLLGKKDLKQKDSDEPPTIH